MKCLKQTQIGLELSVAFILALCAGCESKKPQAALIVGGSMAPAFIGQHYEVTCSDCGYPFSIDGDALPKTGNAVCPNCGFRENDISSLAAKSGDQVKVASNARFKIERGDVVAIKNTRGSESLVVKRVLGLPGEKMQIENGFVVIDRRNYVYGPPLPAINVFDSKFMPSSNSVPDRLLPLRNQSGWKQIANKFVFSPKEIFDDDNVTSWLRYQHWPCFESSLKRTQEVPVKDSLGYNQNLARDLNTIGFCSVTADWKTTNGTAAIEIGREGENVQVHFDYETANVQILSSAWVEPRNYEMEKTEGVKTTTLNVWPGLCEIRVGGELFKTFEIDWPIDASESVEIKMGAKAGKVELSRLRIGRPIYYFNVVDQSSPLIKVVLRDNEYFVLGDNPAVSRDSRHFGPVFRDQIVGEIEQPK